MHRIIGLDLEGGDLDKTSKVQGVLDALPFLDPKVSVHLFSNRDATFNVLECIPHELRDRVFPGANSKDNSLVAMIQQLESGDIDMGLSSEDTRKIGMKSIRSGRMDQVIPSLCVQSFNTGNKSGESLFLDAGFDTGRGKTEEERAIKMVEDVIISSTYVEKLQGITKVKVGLLTNGEERSKGTELIQRVRDILEELDIIDYVGYIEGNHATNGDFDILLTDGHTGNIVLKTVEGQLGSVGGEIRAMIKENGFRGLLAGLLLKKDLEAFKGKRDPDKYPMAIFLGYLKLLGKIHGNAKQEGYTNGVLQADKYIRAEKQHGLIDLSQERLGIFRQTMGIKQKEEA